MAFSGFSQPFVNAYRGFGRYSALATAGAAATAVLSPLLLRNDERGYGRTAALTTPLVAAGYIAAPGLYQGFSDIASQWGEFWKNKPFTFENGVPHWPDYPQMENLLRKSGPKVRQAAAGVAFQKEAQFYASAGRAGENTSLMANQAIETIQGLNHKRNQLKETMDALVKGKNISLKSQQMGWIERLEVRYAIKQARAAKADLAANQGLFGNPDRNRFLEKKVKGALLDVRARRNDLKFRRFSRKLPDPDSRLRKHMPGMVEKWNHIEEQRRFLSNAVYEARLAGLTPEEAIHSGDILPSALPLSEIETRLRNSSGNERFVRTMANRTEQASRIHLGNPLRHSGRAVRTVESLDVATALAELQVAKAGRYVRKAEQLQGLIQSGVIGSRSRIAFGLKDGQRVTGMPMGAIVFDARNDKSVLLPFTNETSSMVSMGAGFRQRGMAVGFWDEGGKYAADDYIISHMGRPFQEVQEVVQGAFQYGGINDPTDPMDAFLHSDFGDAVLPDWAVNLRSRRYRPGPFGGHGSDGSKNFEDLTLEQKTETLARQREAGMTWVGPENKAVEGYLQDAILDMASPEVVPSMEAQDAFFRAMTKPVYFDRNAIRLNAMPRSRIDNQAIASLAGVESMEELPIIQAKMGLVNPQMKSLLGDIPAEAEQSIRAAFASSNETASFNHWRATHSNFDLAEELGLEERKRRRAVDFKRWKGTEDYWSFNVDREKQAMAWWDTAAGRSYAEHARSSFRKMGVAEGQIEGSLLVYKDILARDPLSAAAARQFQTVGEAGFVFDREFYDGLDGVMESTVSLDEFNARDWHPVRPLAKGTVIGYKDGSPVGAKGEMYINDVRETMNETKPGWVVNTRRRLSLYGAKIQAGFGGPKGMVTGGNVRRMTALHNQIVEQIGVGAYLPEDVTALSMNAVTSLKSKTHYADLMTNAAELAAQMVETRYTAASLERSRQFLDELAAGGYQSVTEDGRTKFRFDPRTLATEKDRIRHIKSYAGKSQAYLDDLGRLAVAEGPGGQAGSGGHADLEAYRKNFLAGRTELTFSQYMNQHLNYTPVMMWDHASLSVPSNVKVTPDMLNEMKRAGSVEGLKEVLGQTLWTKGDPARTWDMAEYLRGRDFTAPLGDALGMGDLVIPQGGIKVDSRTGNSPFNPEWKKVQENFSVDLGITLDKVPFAKNETDVRYLPKLGMKAFGGAPDQHNGIWRSTELENLYNEALQSAEALKKTPTEGLKQLTRKKVGAYLDALTSSMVGKEGTLRAEGIAQNASYGVAVARSSGPGGSNPFTITLSDEVVRQFDQETAEALMRGEDVYGPMFRDPVSAAYHVRYRRGVTDKAQLDPFEIGVDTSLSGPYQLDHDKDFLKLIAYRKGSAAEKEAMDAINQKNSVQWMNLKASEAFQGMEDPRAITDAMMGSEFAEKGWLSEKSYLSRLSESAETDKLLMTKRQNILNRLTFGYVGRYSNATTRVQMLLSNNPLLKPGDADYTLLNKLNYSLRQVTLSAVKGKTNLGANPGALLEELNSAIAMGESGSKRAQQVLYKAAEGSGFKSVYTRELGEATGLTHELKLNADGTVERLGELVEGSTVNLGKSYLASERGHEAVRKLLSNPNRSEINRVASMLTSKEVKAEQAMRMLDAAAAGNAANEVLGGVAQATRTPGWVNTAKKMGPRVGSAAEDMSHTLGVANEALKDAWQTGKSSIKPAAKVLGIGVGIAAVAGLATTAVRSSNAHRPEERVAATDHVPGEPIAGVRSSVNPKRRVLPAAQGVKKTVVARMQQGLDLEVKAQAPDREGQMEIAKMVERVAGGGPGVTNISVNRRGGWRDATSKLRLRNQIRDELNRY